MLDLKGDSVSYRTIQVVTQTAWDKCVKGGTGEYNVECNRSTAASAVVSSCMTVVEGRGQASAVDYG